jgi:hypothetical protein
MAKTETTTPEDPRRLEVTTVEWSPEHKPTGYVRIGGEVWSRIHWSEPEQKWCITDAYAFCIEHIYGSLDDRDAAIALAQEMIADGRIPCPEEAFRRGRLRDRGQSEDDLTPEQLAERKKRREQRAKQPAQIRAREERAELDAFERMLDEVSYDVSTYVCYGTEPQPPWREILASLFDFSDPDLWKSNVFASMRPVLVSRLEREVVGLEKHLVYERRTHGWRYKRKPSAANIATASAAVERARQILQHLLGPDGDASTKAICERAKAEREARWAKRAAE